MRHEIPLSSHHDPLRAIGARLRADHRLLVDETEAQLHREQPQVIAQIDPALLREGIAATHARFAALLIGDEPAGAGPRAVALASAASGAGVGVDALLAAYRVGAQVGWRHVARYVAEQEVPSETVLALATASLAYVDELTANSFEGFAREAAAAGGARARERQALLAALVAGDGDLPALAAAARWPLPARLSIAVLRPSGAGAGTGGTGAGGAGAGRAGAGRAGAGGAGGSGGLDHDAILLGLVDGAALAAVAEADEQLLLDAGVPLALGPALPPPQAALSLARARRLASLVTAGRLAGDGPRRWEDHLADLVVHADAAAGETLAARRLAPLDELPPARAQMLRETLAAWLAQPGRPREIAALLHLHPQTVRYRLGRLRERFGAALDDPQARFELALALRLSAAAAD